MNDDICKQVSSRLSEISFPPAAVDRVHFWLSKKGSVLVMRRQGSMAMCGVFLPSDPIEIEKVCKPTT